MPTPFLVLFYALKNIFFNPISLSLFAFRFQRLKYEIDPEYLFSPENGAGKHERAIVEEFFKVNYTSNFNVGRITRAGKYTVHCIYYLQKKPLTKCDAGSDICIQRVELDDILGVIESPIWIKQNEKKNDEPPKLAQSSVRIKLMMHK